MSNAFAPEPDVTGIWVAANDPPLGSAAPTFFHLAGRPTIVAVHSACLSCSLEAYGKAKSTFDAPGVLNVIATGIETYEVLMSKYPKVRTIVADDDLAKSINALFSPRIYAFDAKGNLTYAQSETEKLNDAISHAKSILAAN